MGDRENGPPLPSSELGGKHAAAAGDIQTHGEAISAAGKDSAAAKDYTN